MSQNALLYGGKYHIQNAWNNWGGGYLDTRGQGCQDNLYCVSTAWGKDRDQGSGTWLIKSASGKPDGWEVKFGDSVYLINQYKNGTGGYLDTRGQGCQDNVLCVSTAKELNHGDPNAEGSSTWIFGPGGPSNQPVYEGSSIILQTAFTYPAGGGGNPPARTGGFLDTRGNGCQDNLLCVSTSQTPNTRVGGDNSSSWRFLPAI